MKKEPIVSLTVGDYRRLLLRKPKAEIVKIVVCGSDWPTLLSQLRAEMSRVKNPAEIIASIEIPSAKAACSGNNIIDLLALLMEPYSASRPTLIWGYAEVDETQFRVVVYAC